jgi:hypothetical protein
MKIANPIYDVVFKYMMDDYKIARLILSALLKLEVVELQLQPQEFTISKQQELQKTIRERKIPIGLYRLDFSAKIRSTSGSLILAIIEIQKSKIFSSPFRFRTYLAKQLLNKDNYAEVEVNGKKYKAGIPIISIYLLGEVFNNSFENVPVVNINMEVRDGHSGEILDNSDPFINSLYHQGIIVNIPALKERRRNELETILSIFNQENMQTLKHILEIDETDFPEKFKPILERLAMAVQDPEIQKQMELEDELMAEFDMYQESIEDLERRLAQSEAVIRETNKMALEEKYQKEQAERQKEQAERQKEEERKRNDIAIKSLLSKGMTPQEVSDLLDLPISYIESLREK